MLTFSSVISLVGFCAFGFFLTVIQRKPFFFIFLLILFYVLFLLDLVSLLTINDHPNLFLFFRFHSDMLDLQYLIVPMFLVPFILFCTVSSIIIILFCLARKYFFLLSAEKRKKITLILFIILTPFFLFSQTTRAYKSLAKQYLQYSLGKQISIPKFDTKTNYIYPKDIKAQKGKNLVVIYLESFENTFLTSDRLDGLTPRIKRLIKNGWYQYNNYNEAEGANWTSGALFATQTSFPSFFELELFSSFPEISYLDLISWSRVLKVAGYKNTFMMSDQTFYGGKEYLLKLLEYDIKNYLIPISQDTFWQGHDLDLFEAAKKEYLELSKNPPFNLTLLSVDTHFPKGTPDLRLKDKVNVNANDMHKFTIATTDYLVGDFIDFIYKQPNAENTVIVILGDHLMMGDAFITPLVKEMSQKRKVLLVTNNPIKNYSKDTPIFYYDMPKIILDLAEVKNNAVWSKDLFPEMSEEFTKRNYLSFMGIIIRNSIKKTAKEK